MRSGLQPGPGLDCARDFRLAAGAQAPVLVGFLAMAIRKIAD